MSDFYQELRDWSAGVNVAAEGDNIPMNASPRAWNTAFRSISQGQAVLGTRPGLTMVNSTPVDGAIHWMKPYYYESGGTISRYLALLTDQGSLHMKNSSNVLSSEIVPPANFPNTGTTFVNGSSTPDGTVVRNILFLTNQAGERRCLVNQTFKAWGLEPIATIAVFAAAGGSSSMPAETYSVWVTTYDPATGMESSASTERTITLAANQRVQVQITPTAAETAQYPFWRVYLRRNTTQAVGYRILDFENFAGATIVTDGDIPIGTTTVFADLSASQIANAILEVPSETENDFPTATIKYVAAYGGRLIIADDYNIWWSKIDNLGAFPFTERIDTGDGDEIKALVPFSDDLLLILTANNVMGLYGNDPQTWVLKPIDQSVGCASHVSVAKCPFGVAWWATTVGPVLFDGQGVSYIGLDRLGFQMLTQDNEPTRFGKYYGAYDFEHQRLLWSYALEGSTGRNNAIISYKLSLGQWESNFWDPMDAAALVMADGLNGRQYVFFGGYGGQLFYFDTNVQNDGVPGGTMTGTFVASASTVGSITGAGFYTTGAGLLERKVTLIDSEGRPQGRARITSNTGTQIDFTPAFTGLSVGATYRYYIGGPDVRVYTKWIDAEQPFQRKRFDRVFLHASSANDSVDLAVGTQVEFIDSSVPAQQTFSIDGAVWDELIWDSSTWAGAGSVKKRLGVFRNTTALRVAIFHHVPDKDIVLLKVAVQGRTLSERYHGV